MPSDIAHGRGRKSSEAASCARTLHETAGRRRDTRLQRAVTRLEPRGATASAATSEQRACAVMLLRSKAVRACVRVSVTLTVLLLGNAIHARWPLVRFRFSAFA